MLEIFQGETGGSFSFDLKGIPAVTGTMTIYPPTISGQLIPAIIVGTISSGYLNIQKELIPTLPATVYTVIVKVIDNNGLSYIITPEELKVIRVP